jgi:hypothetical protein
MAASRCFRPAKALQNVFATTKSSKEAPIPAFLVPAYASHFSTTTPCRSKIGRAPLSLPPEVKFTVTKAPPARANARAISTVEQGSTVDIEGPRGKMSLHIPAYMSIEGSDEGRTQTVRILDAEERKQREMCGAYNKFQWLFLCCAYSLRNLCEQAQSEPTFRTTSLAYQKATQPSCGLLVSVTERQSRTRQLPCRQNTPDRNSSPSKSDTHTPSSLEYLKVWWPAPLSPRGYCWKVSTRRL